MVTQLSCGGLKRQPQAGSTQKISQTFGWADTKLSQGTELHLTLNFNK